MKVKEDSQIGVRRLSGGRGQLGGGLAISWEG